MTATVAAVLVGGVLLAPPPAQAHNSFAASTPKDKAVLDKAPATVVLRFLSRLDPAGTKVALTGPDGSAAQGGPARFDGPSVTVPLVVGVAGAYQASYEVASPDGHPVRGRITFTLTAAAVPSPSPSPGPVSPPTSAAGAPQASATPPAPGPGVATVNRDPGTPWWPWLLGGAVLAGAVILVLVVRRRRNATG